jgi:hypothetical protein
VRAGRAHSRRSREQRENNSFHKQTSPRLVSCSFNPQAKVNAPLMIRQLIYIKTRIFVLLKNVILLFKILIMYLLAKVYLETPTKRK